MTCILRFALIILFIILVKLPLHCQLSIGIKSGINVAKLSIRENPDGFRHTRTFTTGYILGTIMEIGVTKNLFIQSEIIVLQKGNAITKIDNIDIPLLVKKRLIHTDYLRVSFLAGPSLGWAFKGKQERLTTSSDNYIAPIDFNSKYGFRRFNFEVITGMEIGTKLKTIVISGDIRYLYGINDIDYDTNLTTRNRGLNITFGVLFNLSN